MVDIKKPPGLVVREASQRGRACPYVRKPPRGMIMVASTTLVVSTVRACYHGHRALSQAASPAARRGRSDAADEIAFDALSRERDDGVQRMSAKCLLHLAEQRIQALHRLDNITGVGARWWLDIGQRHPGSPLIRWADLLEGEGRHRLESMLALELHEAPHRRAQAAMAFLDAWGRKVAA